MKIEGYFEVGKATHALYVSALEAYGFPQERRLAIEDVEAEENRGHQQVTGDLVLNDHGAMCLQPVYPLQEISMHRLAVSDDVVLHARPASLSNSSSMF